MRVALFALAAAVAWMFAGCQQQPFAPRQPRYELSMKVTAEECAPTCRFVSARVHVRNTGDGLLCVPDVYDERNPGTVMIRYRSGQWIELLKPSDGNLFLSPRQADSLAYISWPQRVLHPGETLNIGMTLDGLYDLKAESAEAMLDFIAFDCASTKAAPVAKAAQASAAVAFS
jgi:hypothetical protein